MQKNLLSERLVAVFFLVSLLGWALLVAMFVGPGRVVAPGSPGHAIARAFWLGCGLLAVVQDIRTDLAAGKRLSFGSLFLMLVGPPFLTVLVLCRATLFLRRRAAAC